MKVVLNTDGGVRTGGKNGPTQGKTGLAGIAAVIKSLDGKTLFKGGLILADPATVNEAEYSAVIFGLYEARTLGATHVEVRSDSQLVIMQITKVWAVKTRSLDEYLEEVRNEVEEFEEVTFTWIPREQNQHADLIARELLDAEVGPTTP